MCMYDPFLFVPFAFKINHFPSNFGSVVVIVEAITTTTFTATTAAAAAAFHRKHMCAFVLPFDYAIACVCHVQTQCLNQITHICVLRFLGSVSLSLSLLC